MSNTINSIKNNKLKNFHPDYGSLGRQVGASGSPRLGRPAGPCSGHAIRGVAPTSPKEPDHAVRGRYGGLRPEAPAKEGRPPGQRSMTMLP